MGAFHIMASLRRTELLNGLQLYLTFLFYILIISGPVLPHEPKYTLVMDFFGSLFLRVYYIKSRTAHGEQQL